MSPLAHSLFWSGGSIVGVGAAAYVLYRRGVWTSATTLAVVAATLGVTIGSKWQYRLEYLPVLDALLVPTREFLSPPARIPLGLVLGAVLAGFVCLLTRAPWREVGDALAVGAAAMISIGRFGCLFNGCCSGTLCPQWMQALCLRYPVGSEAFGYQLAAGLLTPASRMSLPVHPLPLYFAASAFAILVILVFLLRRNVEAGTLLAVFCILRPLSKLALEPLRASAPGGPRHLILIVPLSVLGATCLILLVRAVWSRASRDHALAAARSGRSLESEEGCGGRARPSAPAGPAA